MFILEAINTVVIPEGDNGIYKNCWKYINVCCLSVLWEYAVGVEYKDQSCTDHVIQFHSLSPYVFTQYSTIIKFSKHQLYDKIITSRDLVKSFSHSPKLQLYFRLYAMLYDVSSSSWASKWQWTNYISSVKHVSKQLKFFLLSLKLLRLLTITTSWDASLIRSGTKMK